MGKVIVGVNAAALLVFVVAFFYLGAAAAVEAEHRFTDLDRAGVINADALERFAPSYGFGDARSLAYRVAVPAWLSGPAVGWLRVACAAGAVVAGVNVALGAAWVVRRPAKPQA